MTDRSYFPLFDEADPQLPRPEAGSRRRPGTGRLSPANSLKLSLKELIRYYRHSGAGRLVVGLAHRMNSPLQVLSFQLELLDQKSLEEEELLSVCPPIAAAGMVSLHKYRREKLRQFRTELGKLQALARGLILQGVHEEAQDKTPLNLNQVIGDQLDLYQADPFFQHRVRKDIQLQPGLPLIAGYYLDFSQSLRNLLDNALEAMAAAEPRVLTVTTALKDGRLILAVGDTGPGIPDEVRPLLFQPFVTAKQGHTGLGLFMVQRLLAPYGADIQVDRTPGGARVLVSLPV